MRGAEILEVLHAQPATKEYLMSLYDCKYSEFFKSLGKFIARPIGVELLVREWLRYLCSVQIVSRAICEHVACLDG